MKTIYQINRYTADCLFSDEDWQKILDFCRNIFGGGKLHRLKGGQAESTYIDFVNWFDNGWGHGDVVGYGKTIGIIGHILPGDKVILSAYYDYEHNLIINDMCIKDYNRIIEIDNEQKIEFKRKLYLAGFDFPERHCRLTELYTPQKYYYVIINDDSKDMPDVGMYLESNGDKHHFIAFLSDNELKLDCWIDSECTPLRQARTEDIKRFHNATTKAGLTYNERLHSFIKATGRRIRNTYWYLNECFQLVMDKDNGSKKHQVRFDAGNYFIDQQEGIMFMLEVKKLRGKA